MYIVLGIQNSKLFTQTINNMFITIMFSLLSPNIYYNLNQRGGGGRSKKSGLFRGYELEIKIA